MGGYLVGSTGTFCSAEAREDVKQFFTTHPVPSSDRAFKNALEHIDGCIELRTLQGPNLDKWLATHNSK
jgi:aminopeptidase N/puromycin-sensitive aminopeptidase